MSNPGWLYVLHFDDPLCHAQHYLGSTRNPTERWIAHATGNGARLTEVLHDRNLQWTVAAVFQTLPGIDHLAAERHAKRQKNTAIYCPICNPKKHVSPKNTIETPFLLPNSTELKNHDARANQNRRLQILRAKRKNLHGHERGPDADQ